MQRAIVTVRSHSLLPSIANTVSWDRFVEMLQGRPAYHHVHKHWGDQLPPLSLVRTGWLWDVASALDSYNESLHREIDQKKTQKVADLMVRLQGPSDQLVKPQKLGRAYRTPRPTLSARARTARDFGSGQFRTLAPISLKPRPRHQSSAQHGRCRPAFLVKKTYDNLFRLFSAPNGTRSPHRIRLLGGGFRPIA